VLLKLTLYGAVAQDIFETMAGESVTRHSKIHMGIFIIDFEAPCLEILSKLGRLTSTVSGRGT
jgi:hypothetical protein